MRGVTKHAKNTNVDTAVEAETQSSHLNSEPRGHVGLREPKQSPDPQSCFLH